MNVCPNNTTKSLFIFVYIFVDSVYFYLQFSRFPGGISIKMYKST